MVRTFYTLLACISTFHVHDVYASFKEVSVAYFQALCYDFHSDSRSIRRVAEWSGSATLEALCNTELLRQERDFRCSNVVRPAAIGLIRYADTIRSGSLATVGESQERGTETKKKKFNAQRKDD